MSTHAPYVPGSMWRIPGGKLRPGMFVEVELLDPHGEGGQGSRAPSLVVPEAAIARGGAERFVFVVAGEHRYERREVRLGREAGGDVEILEGVDTEDIVVVDGTFLLKSKLSEDSLGGGHAH